MWDEPTLVSFLIVFLLYATYQPLRFSIEDPEKQSRYAAVFAIVAGAFVPLNFMAVRLADPLIHPRVLNTSGGDLPGDMKLAFYTAIIGMTLLFITLYKMEMTGKHNRAQLKALRRAPHGRRPRDGRPQRRARGWPSRDAPTPCPTTPATSPRRTSSSSRCC